MTEETLHCNTCDLDFKNNTCHTKHLKTSRHIQRSTNNNIVLFSCICGRSYSYHQSLYVHHKKCEQYQHSKKVNPVVRVDHQAIVESMKEKHNAIVEAMQHKIDVYKKERKEMKDKIAVLQHTAANKCKDSETHQKSRDKRRNINKQVKQRIVDKQEKSCGECKLALTPYFQIDHIIGLQFGGTDDESNLMALCCECHAIKSIGENQCRKQIQDAIQTILREKRNNDLRQVSYIASSSASEASIYKL